MTKSSLKENFCQGYPDKAKLSSAHRANYAECMIWVFSKNQGKAESLPEDRNYCDPLFFASKNGAGH